jgi:hypothetical protein
MARVADKPGEWRVRVSKHGGVLLSGVNLEGRRVKVPFGSRTDAERAAGSLFPAKSAPIDWEGPKDDWGLPIRVSDTTVASGNLKLGIGQPAPIPTLPAGPITAPVVVTEKEREARQIKKAKQAQSLMEMIGFAGAAGDVMLGVKLCEIAEKDPVKPNPRQVGDLAESLKETLTEWFGDRDIKPWQMTILLALGIPLTMLIQSKKKEPDKIAESSKSSAAK